MKKLIACLLLLSMCLSCLVLVGCKKKDNGDKVPDILLSGHHENIRKWRLLQSLLKTRELRPDLFAAHELSKEEKKLLEEYDKTQE